MIHWEKQSIMLYVFDFKKGAANRFTRSNGFSMHQTFKMKLPTSRK